MKMKTRVIVLILVALLALGLTASAAASGPPWPAVVIHDTAWCDEQSWPSSYDPYETWLPIQGTGIEVQHLENGSLKITCRMQIDFNDPNYMTMEAGCSDPGYYSWLCRGKHTMVNNDIECGVFSNDEYFPSTSANVVVNKTGLVAITCLFRDLPK
jgi:hypothetical protein